jgi:hypothetical protein
MNCTFAPDSDICTRCGLRSKWPDVPRTCTLGVGDIIAAGLAAVGITKERVEAVVGAPCGCAERQSALNQLGRSLGIGTPPDAEPPA